MALFKALAISTSGGFFEIKLEYYSIPQKMLLMIMCEGEKCIWDYCMR